MAKQSPTDEAIVEQAERRAALSSYLHQNAGEHSVASIAEALEMRPNVTGKILKDMVDNGLISPPRREKGINYYRDSGDVAPTKRAYTKRPKTSASVKDIELVVGGTMIVIGRNPDSGRIRIVLEDIA